MADAMIAAALLAGSACVGAAGYLRAKANRDIVLEDDYATYPDALEGVKLYMVERTKEDSIHSSMSDDDLKRRKKL